MTHGATIEVGVLGPLEVRRAGALIAIDGAKPRAILTMLGLHPGHVIPANVLQEVLWGEDGIPRTAQKALLTHVAVLRRALGEGVVVTKGAGWALSRVSTDASRFEAAAEAGRRALRDDSLTTAVEQLTEALRLWRGPPDLPATPRATAELTRWVEIHESIVDDRTDARLGLGQTAELIGELESAVAETPLRERRWEQLCLALYRAGRQGDALAAYHRARTVLSDELGVEPGPDLRQLEAAILRQDAGLDVPAPQTGEPAGSAEPAELSEPAESSEPAAPAGPAANLPTPRTAFVGRRTELSRLDHLLRDHRLVTITGPGGVGKTRLAIAAASAAAPTYPGGVWFVDLAPVRPDLLTETIAARVGVTDQPGRAIMDGLCAHFGALGGAADSRALLVLDNCEHLADDVCGFLDQLLPRCPTLGVLATSRERLRAADEQVLTAPPLPFAANGAVAATAEASDAAQLFRDRARAVEPDFDADPALVDAVCTRCDGLPLAIELAAARSGSLGVDGLLAGLDDHVRVLVGARSGNERHRSLRAVLDWSHHLLDAEEQALFRQVSIFAGSFDLDAATAIMADLPRSTVVDLIGRLTDKNLLVHEHTTPHSRWRMLNVVRSYAGERLAVGGGLATVRVRYLRWATETAVALERRLDAGEPWHAEFDLVAADLRAALAVIDTGDGRLTLALALARLYARNGAFTFAQSTYEHAMSMARLSGDAHQLARAALGASTTGMLFGVTHSGRVVLLEEALAALGAEPSDTKVRLLARLSTELYWSADRDRSLALATEATAMAATLGSPGAGAHAFYALQYVRRSPGTSRERLVLTERVVDLAVTAGETQLELAGRAARAVGLMEAGDLDGMDAEVAALTEAADRRDHPEFQWYAAVYRLVRALVAGRFAEADELAAAAADASRYAPEFAVGLFFAEAVTDLRELDEAGLRKRAYRLDEMAERFPRVFVWRCLQLLTELALNRRAGPRKRAAALVDELLAQPSRDGHWLLGCSLLAEVAAALPDVELATPLEEALRPYADSLAVAGRVAAFRGSVSHALGLLTHTLGRTRQAIADLEAAARRHQQIRARPFHERSLRALAWAGGPSA